ncbi:hypothetical protein [Bacillus sp. FJAT-44742]|nr:hypothetical protein [Bacillus sp. FJAT-44742]
MKWFTSRMLHPAVFCSLILRHLRQYWKDRVTLFFIYYIKMLEGK